MPRDLVELPVLPALAEVIEYLPFVEHPKPQRIDPTRPKSLTPEQKKIVQGAIQILEADGWAQFTWSKRTGEHCLMHAMAISWQGNGGDPSASSVAQALDTCHQMARILGFPDASAAIIWNDQHGRQYKEVIERLRWLLTL